MRVTALALVAAACGAPQRPAPEPFTCRGRQASIASESTDVQRRIELSCRGDRPLVAFVEDARDTAEEVDRHAENEGEIPPDAWDAAWAAIARELEAADRSCMPFEGQQHVVTFAEGGRTITISCSFTDEEEDAPVRRLVAAFETPLRELRTRQPDREETAE